MKVSANQTVIEMEGFDQEIFAPEEFLNLTPEQRRNILKSKAVIKSLGAIDLADSAFVAINVRWKNPIYKIKL